MVFNRRVWDHIDFWFCWLHKARCGKLSVYFHLKVGWKLQWTHSFPSYTISTNSIACLGGFTGIASEWFSSCFFFMLELSGIIPTYSLNCHHQYLKMHLCKPLKIGRLFLSHCCIPYCWLTDMLLKKKSAVLTLLYHSIDHYRSSVRQVNLHSCEIFAVGFWKRGCTRGLSLALLAIVLPLACN